MSDARDKLPNLSESDVAALLSYRELIDCMRDALIAFSAGEILQPVRNLLPVEPDQRYFAAMPAVIPRAMGAKMVSFYPKNAGTGWHTHLASILLLDPEYGQPLAIMDGRLITEMRTAATSVAASRPLIARGPRTLALLGSGVQAKAHLTALRTEYDLEDIRVWSRSEASARAFAEHHGARACTAQDAVRGADIVVCATNARTPVLNGEWLRHGAHVISVGSPRPGWREMDDTTMQNLVIVDSREATLAESGDIILSGATIYAEAGEVLAGTRPVDPARTTIFKSVGIAVEDIAAARLVYDLYLARQEARALA